MKLLRDKCTGISINNRFKWNKWAPTSLTAVMKTLFPNVKALTHQKEAFLLNKQRKTSKQSNPIMKQVVNI